MAGMQNDSTDVKPAEGFDPLPAGVYKVVITASDVVPTKSGNGGEIAKYTAEVIDGPHAGRKIFHQLNFVNPNPVAERIGKAEQSALQHGAGRLKIGDTAELHGIPMYWKLGISPANGDFPAKNKVIAVYHISDPKAQGKPAAAGTGNVGTHPPASPPMYAPQTKPQHEIAPAANTQYQAPAGTPATPATAPWQRPASR